MKGASFLVIPKWVLCKKELTLSARITYAALLSHVDENGECSPAQETLAEMVGISKRMINYNLDKLIELNLIGKKYRGLTKTNLYFIYPQTGDTQTETTTTPLQNKTKGNKRRKTPKKE